jgi:hypothetical protein
MNRRRVTKGLSNKLVNEMTRGWQHARRIGYPLNVMVTIHPFEELNSVAACKLAANIRNKLGVSARQHGFPFVAAWARECDPNGTGEHIHILMHVPPRKFGKLERTVMGWFPEPGAADVSRRDQKVFVTANGKQKSAIGYITKQMLPQACWRRPRIRRAGGPILGKRGGVTRNIGPAAIERYFRDCRAERPQFAAALASEERPLNPTAMLPQPQTSTDLLGALAEVAGERIINSKTWPSNARLFTGRLGRAEPSVPSVSKVKGTAAQVSAGSDMRMVGNGAHGPADANDPGNAPTIRTTIPENNSKTTADGADAPPTVQPVPSDEVQPQRWITRI